MGWHIFRLTSCVSLLVNWFKVRGKGFRSPYLFRRTPTKGNLTVNSILIFMRFKYIFISCFLAALNIATMAQTKRAWTLQDCIDHAMRHNLEIKLQQQNEVEARHAVQQSRANFLPSVNADVSHGYSFGRSVDPFTNEFSNERIMRQNAWAGSSWVLFSGFQNVNYLHYNLLRHTAMRHDSEKLKNEIILVIAAAYMQILYSEDFLETATQQIDIIRQQVNRTQALHQGGMLPRGSVLEIEARLAEEELNLITAQNNLRLSYLELIQLLDLDPSENFTIVRPETQISDQLVIMDPDMIFNRAMQVQPSITAAESRVAMARRSIAFERGRYSPTLSLVANMSTGYSEASTQFIERLETGPVQIGSLGDGTPVFTQGFRNVFGLKPWEDQIRDNFSQYIGLNLRIPVFNRFDVRTRVQQSRVELDRAQTRYELARNNLNKAIHQAHADAVAAFQKYQATSKSLDAFEESFGYTRQRFELGMVSSVEFNDSQARLARAEREALQAKYDYILKTKIMEFYMGQGISL
jgi:outer membrane protein